MRRPGADAAREAPLDVYFTVDVEVWCDGWADIDSRFAACFRRYVYGPTPQGDYGLPYTLRVLNDSGLTGTFFVEPLFAARFGPDPLAEIVGLLKDAGQDIQLHLHTEWVDEARTPLLPQSDRKRQYLRMFSLDEQRTLLDCGRRLLVEAGVARIDAFRAGSFGFNDDTITALAHTDIPVDASYNATMFGPSSGVAMDGLLTDVAQLGNVTELPMTVFDDGWGRLRHVQLTACSWGEIEALLWQALRTGQRAFVILSHNFELLDTRATRPDGVVVDRFRSLCRFLRRHDGLFRLRHMGEAVPAAAQPQPAPLRSSRWRTAARLAEQAWRRVAP